MAKRILKDRALTNLEKQHRYNDAHASIDDTLDQALSNVNWQRRKQAENSLVDWVRTYAGHYLDTMPSEYGCQVLDELDENSKHSGNYNLVCFRGMGKSSYSILDIIYYIVTSKSTRLVMLISQNQRSANNLMNEIWRFCIEPDTPFAIDYPEIFIPLTINPTLKRRQLYKGQSTEVQHNSSTLVFARLKKDDGTEFNTSESQIICRGYNSGLRGIKSANGKHRPNLILCDDWQTEQTAHNPESVEKMYQILNSDVMGLSGKERISIIITQTRMAQDDLVDRLIANRNWKTSIHKCIISYPKNMELWKTYLEMWQDETINQKSHIESLEFYKRNFDEMNEGCQMFAPDRFSKNDGHISAIQKMLELKLTMGAEYFNQEYQNEIQKTSYQLELKPETILSRINGLDKNQIADGYNYVFAASDLNISTRGIITTICAFDRCGSCNIINHFVHPTRIPTNIPESEYNQKLYNELMIVGQKIKALNLNINGWGIDQNGLAFSAVGLFVKQAQRILSLPIIGMIGKAHHLFNPYYRNRLKDSINFTCLCGDAQERIKSGSGIKWLYFSSCYYHEQIIKGFIQSLGNIGGYSLYQPQKKNEHTELALEVCNQKLKKITHKQDGIDCYDWQTKSPNDYFDALAMCAALLGHYGISGTNAIQRTIKTTNPIRRKRKIKFV